MGTEDNFQILWCQCRRYSPYSATLAPYITGGHIILDPGVLGLAEKSYFDCEENLLVYVHAFCTGLGEWCPHMKVDDTYSFTVDEARIAPIWEWCPPVISDPGDNSFLYPFGFLSVGGAALVTYVTRPEGGCLVVRRHFAVKSTGVKVPCNNIIII